jgi:hypothetical protein
MRVGDAINLYQTAHALQMKLRTIGRGSVVLSTLRNACGRSEMELWIGLRSDLHCPPASKNRGAGFSFSFTATCLRGVGGVKISG